MYSNLFVSPMDCIKGGSKCEWEMEGKIGCWVVDPEVWEVWEGANMLWQRVIGDVVIAKQMRSG